MSSPTPAAMAHARRPLPRPIRQAVLPATLVTALVATAAVAALGPAAPASAAGDSTTYAVGATAIALNQPSDPEMGSITPAADAATNGMFGTQSAWPVIPVHVAVGRNGHLISYGTPLDTKSQGGLQYDDWNVSAGFGRNAHTDSATMKDYNSFCNSMVELADGRLLMVGGNSTMSTMTYDPATGAQAMGQDLTTQRWYATTLRLTDNRILVLGGANYYNTGAYNTPNDDTGVATTPEIGTGLGAWTQLKGATSALAYGAKDNRWWYPRAFNGPNGSVVGMSGDQIWNLSTTGTGAVTIIGTLPFNPKVSGSQVMYAPGKILVAGGGQPFNEDASPATNKAAVVDVSGATAKVTATASMANARNWLNLTVLPTGEVFANGGTKVGTQAGDANSVKQSEIWTPATGTWRTAATAQRTRTYHSTSLVLPSGAVFTGGGGVPGPEDNLNAELYYPSSLFTKGADGTVKWASRPAISTIAGSATYGGQVALGIADGRAIASASLISLPSVTHSQNTDQRRIPLAITQKAGAVTATLPASVNTMPQGDYELTVVDANGVPSAAQIITVRQGAAGSVTVGAATQVQGTGAASADPATGTVPLTVDSTVGFEAVNYPGYRLQHGNFAAQLKAATAASDTATKDGTSWIVRTGLASADGTSFESVDWPGYYLAAPANGAAGAIGLVQNDGTTAFAGRATFKAVTGNNGQNTSLQSWSNTALYLRHQNFQFSVQALDGTDLMRADTTFAIRAGLTAAPAVPLTAGRAIGLEASNFAGYRMEHANYQVWLKQLSAASAKGDRDDSSWIVRSGLAGAAGVSFESVGFPGYFLAAPAKGAGATGLVKNDGSTAFAARATFRAVAGTAGTGTSFQTWSDKALYLRHQNFQVLAQALDGSALAKADTTFVVRTALSPAPTK